MSRFVTMFLALAVWVADGPRICEARKPGKVALRVETFSDAAMTEPASSCAPGSVIYYRVAGRAPSDAEGRAAEANLVAKAVVAGIAIPYSFKTAFKLPLKDPIDPQRPVGFDGTEKSHAGKVEVPSFMPGGTLDLKATVRVTGARPVTVRSALAIERE